MTETKSQYKLETVIAACEAKGTPLAVAQFSHPHDQHLFGVLVDLGEEYVTWVYNAESGGFSHGHYYHKQHAGPNARANAAADFKTRFQ